MTISDKELLKTILGTGIAGKMVDDSLIKKLPSIRNFADDGSLPDLSTIYNNTKTPLESKDEMHWLPTIARRLKFHKIVPADINRIITLLHQGSQLGMDAVKNHLNLIIKENIHQSFMEINTDFDPRQPFGITTRISFNSAITNVAPQDLEALKKIIDTLDMYRLPETNVQNANLKETWASLAVYQPLETDAKSITKYIETAEAQINNYIEKVLKLAIAHRIDPDNNPFPDGGEPMILQKDIEQAFPNTISLELTA